MPPSPHKVVILAQPRTGSTLICSLLSSHPGVRVLCEPINPIGHNHHMQPMAGSRCLLPEFMVQNNIKRALNMLFDQRPPPDQWVMSKKVATKAAGFKIMAHQLRALRSEPEFWKYIIEHNVKVILTFRRDIIMQYVSDLITQQTRQPVCWAGDPLTARVRVPLQTLGSELRRIKMERRYLIVKSQRMNRRTVFYEEFCDSVEPIEELLPWLIGERGSLKTKLRKQNPAFLRDRVANFDALMAELKRLGINY